MVDEFYLKWYLEVCNQEYEGKLFLFDEALLPQYLNTLMFKVLLE